MVYSLRLVEFGAGYQGVQPRRSDPLRIAPAPLLPGEREADYVNLIARVVAVARPRDAIEEF
jgi:hypothetical protein